MITATTKQIEYVTNSDCPLDQLLFIASIAKDHCSMCCIQDWIVAMQDNEPDFHALDLYTNQILNLTYQRVSNAEELLGPVLANLEEA